MNGMGAELARIQKRFEDLVEKTNASATELQKLRLDNLIKLIEDYGKVVYSTDNMISKELYDLRQYAQKVKRRQQLQSPSSLDEFICDLWWIGEQGDEKDLELLHAINNNPPFTSERIERLIGIAIQNIERRC